MSQERPASSHLARTLEPREREQVDAMRRNLQRPLVVVVGSFLVVVLGLALWIGPMEKPEADLRITAFLVVASLASAIFYIRWGIGRISKDLERGSVYELEGTVENILPQVQRQRVRFKLKISGERFNVTENQLQGIFPGATCRIEFLPATRFALSVNGIKRWP